MERIDKIISNNTNYTRSDVNKLVRSNRVKVNDIIIKSKDYKVDVSKDIIYIDDDKIDINKYIYLVLNKPKGYVSATVDNRDRTVLELVSDLYRKRNLFPVGRLDKDTTGLMIITDDGDFAHDILSPKKHVSKRYFVVVNKKIDDGLVSKFREGVNIGDYITKSSYLEILNDYSAYVTIYEGKYHQIKRMFKVNGLDVIELKRVRMGGFSLPGDLDVGEVRLLTNLELEKLKEYE